MVFFKRSGIKKRKWSGILNGGYIKLKILMVFLKGDFKVPVLKPVQSTGKGNYYRCGTTGFCRYSVPV